MWLDRNRWKIIFFLLISFFVCANFLYWFVVSINRACNLIRIVRPHVHTSYRCSRHCSAFIIYSIIFFFTLWNNYCKYHFIMKQRKAEKLWFFFFFFFHYLKLKLIPPSSLRCVLCCIIFKNNFFLCFVSSTELIPIESA